MTSSARPGQVHRANPPPGAGWPNLGATFSHYQLLYNSLVALRFPPIVKRVKFGVPPLVAVVVLIKGLADGHWLDALGIALVVPSLVIVSLGVYALVHGAIAMNTPANALLVPHLRRRLITLVLGFWLLTWPIALVFALPHGLPPLSVVLYAGTWLIGMCVALVPRQQTLAMLVQVPLIVATMAYRQLPAWLTVFINSDLGLAAAAVFMMAFGWHAIGVMFPPRGQASVNPVTLAQKITVESMMKISGRHGVRLYALALRRDCQGAPSARRLLTHIFGPLGHWSIAVQPAAIMLIVALVVRLLLLAFASPTSLAAVVDRAWIPATLFALFSCVGARVMLGHLSATKVEQSVLRLAPLFAADSQFNRQFAAGMLGRWAVEWLLNTLMLLALTLVLGGGFAALTLVGATCALGMPAGAALLQDFARRKEVAALSVIAWTLAGDCLIVPLALLGVLGLGLPPAIAIVLAAPLVVALLLAVRWRTITAAPHAFPVERMA
jgi:hypothetical protein